MEKAEQYERAGCTVTIYFDPYPVNPRTDYDHLGTIAHWHRRYDFGEQISPDETGVDSIDGLADWAKAERGATVVLPVYLYDHSGQTISTSPFSCPWDSGQVGIIFDTPEGREKIGTPPELIAEALEAEVREYDLYLTGQVYGYEVERDGEFVDSCWGFLGDLDYVRSEANAAADAEGEAHASLGSYEAAH